MPWEPQLLGHERSTVTQCARCIWANATGFQYTRIMCDLGCTALPFLILLYIVPLEMFASGKSIWGGNPYVGAPVHACEEEANNCIPLSYTCMSVRTMEVATMNICLCYDIVNTPPTISDVINGTVADHNLKYLIAGRPNSHGHSQSPRPYWHYWLAPAVYLMTYIIILPLIIVCCTMSYALLIHGACTIIQ